MLEATFKRETGLTAAIFSLSEYHNNKSNILFQ